jgi:hypothetical protein
MVSATFRKSLVVTSDGQVGRNLSSGYDNARNDTQS